MSEIEPKGKAKGGVARAQSLTPEQRKEIASKAIAARWEGTGIQKAIHEGNLPIGGVDLPCYILPGEIRVLSTRGIMKSLNRTWRGRKYSGTELPVFLEANNLKPFISNDLLSVLEPIEFKTLAGVKAEGFKAEVLPAVCEIYLKARESGKLTNAQMAVAQQCEILMRGLARVGIIALVDEATGYQHSRERDALAKILEAFVAKELQPYVKTFPADYYEQLFRLYNLPYPPVGNKSWRPSFFGKITNDVIYSRLAPDILPELKKAASKAEKKSKLHQWLTNDIGHPKLREHLASIVTILKLSKTPQEFKDNVDRIHTRYGNTVQIPFDYPE